MNTTAQTEITRPQNFPRAVKRFFKVERIGGAYTVLTRNSKTGPWLQDSQHAKRKEADEAVRRAKADDSTE